MTTFSDKWFASLLACPDCRGSMALVGDKLNCSSCEYSCNTCTPIDIKPRNPSALSITHSRLISPFPDKTLNNINLSAPDNNYTGLSAIRDSSALMSEICHYLQQGCVLDLGCGPRDQAAPVEHLGFQYVGIDYTDTAADMLADAHAIPFEDETFNCVLSYAVLEHLHDPFIAIREINRVLKPGGLYIGTVSQGEPFHDSFFHHTAWGILSLMSSMPNFEIKRLWGTGDTIASLSRMGRYPRVIKHLLRYLDQIHIKLPFLAPRKQRWPEKQKQMDALYRAGSIGFVIIKNH